MNQPATEFEIALTICAVIFIMSLLGMLLVLAHAWAKVHDLKIIQFEQGASKFGPMTEEAIAEANSPDQACAQDAFSIPLEIHPGQWVKVKNLQNYPPINLNSGMANDPDRSVFGYPRKGSENSYNDEEVPPSLHPQVDIFRVRQ